MKLNLTDSGLFLLTIPPAPFEKVKPISKASPDTISFSVQRDFSDDSIELAVEVLEYIPEHQGGCWDERLPAHVELGDAFTLDGKSFELTPLELEAAAVAAIKEIEARE